MIASIRGCIYRLWIFIIASLRGFHSRCCYRIQIFMIASVRSFLYRLRIFILRGFPIATVLLWKGLTACAILHGCFLLMGMIGSIIWSLLRQILWFSFLIPGFVSLPSLLNPWKHCHLDYTHKLIATHQELDYSEDTEQFPVKYLQS